MLQLWADAPTRMVNLIASQEPALGHCRRYDRRYVLRDEAKF